MAFSEVYTALQLGAIEGQENPVEVPYNNKFAEIQGQLNITQHIADSFLGALSKNAWEGIPEEHRDAVQQAADEMIAAAGVRPASRQRSTLPSVWPLRTSTPPLRERSGFTCPGFTKSCGPYLGSMAI